MNLWHWQCDEALIGGICIKQLSDLIVFFFLFFVVVFFFATSVNGHLAGEWRTMVAQWSQHWSNELD